MRARNSFGGIFMWKFLKPSALFTVDMDDDQGLLGGALLGATKKKGGGKKPRKKGINYGCAILLMLAIIAILAYVIMYPLPGTVTP